MDSLKARRACPLGVSLVRVEWSLSLFSKMESGSFKLIFGDVSMMENVMVRPSVAGVQSAKFEKRRERAPANRFDGESDMPDPAKITSRLSSW